MTDESQIQASALILRVKQALVFLFRVMAVVALACLVLFPVYKKQPLGAIPVVLGFAVVLVLIKREKWWQSLETRIGGLREGFFVIWLLVIPALLQSVLLFSLQPMPLQDASHVIKEAAEWSQTGKFSALTYYPPLKTLWYGVFFKVFGTSLKVAHASNVLLSSMVIFAFYGLCSAVLSRSRARLAAICLAGYPGFLCYVLITPYYFYLYTFFILCTAWAWFASEVGTRKNRSAFSSGLLAGLGALTKPVLLLAPAQAGVIWMCAAGAIMRKKPWRLLSLFMVGFFLVLTPWGIRNARVFNAFVPVCTSGGLVLYSANNPESNGLFTPLENEANIENAADMLTYSRLHAEEAKRFMWEHPGTFLKLVLRKVLHTWGNEATFAEWINIRGQKQVWVDRAFSFLFQWGWSVLVVGWVLRAWFKGWRNEPVSPMTIIIAVFVLLNVAVYAVFEGGARHHVPLVPLLLLYVLMPTRTDIPPE